MIEEDIDNWSNECNFQSSKLGSQDYWKEYFIRDLENYHDHNDHGEIWFGIQSVKRIIQWILKRQDLTKNSRIIDVGCGNGMMLIELAKLGFSQLVGVDYIDEAIQLANQISSHNNFTQFITYEVGDLLDLHSANVLSSVYNVVLDKGVYDAICLSNTNLEENKLLYISNIHKLCGVDSIFIITSCNWTQNELKSQFSEYFELVETIPTSTFSFGGKIGSKETVIVFRKLIVSII